jgi:hypothetical protein
MRGPHPLAAAALVLAVPVLAHAQARGPSLDELSRAIPPSEDVWVTDAAGNEVKARIVGATASTITIETRDGRRDLAVTDVSRVRRKYNDRVWNGALIGFVSSVVYPIWYFSRMYESGESLGENWDSVIFSGLVGAAVGACIDLRIKGRRVVYQRPGSTTGVRVGPLMARRGAGVQVTVAFSPAAR